MFNWRLIGDHFKQMNAYIAFGSILFLAGMVIGGTNPAFDAFLGEQLQGLKQLKQIIDNSSNPNIMLIMIIFLNNAIKSILVMYLGALFGVLPFFFLVVNGMVIGYLLQTSAELHGGGYVMVQILKGLLPHGVLEIPAIIIACAYGMQFGVLVLKAGGSVMFARASSAKLGRELKSFVVRSVPVMVILTIVLLIAAVIEGTITRWLVTM